MFLSLALLTCGDFGEFWGTRLIPDAGEPKKTWGKKPQNKLEVFVD